jgi:endonuclease/exonuclease/phosphatase family metal-dependent hydrolase
LTNPLVSSKIKVAGQTLNFLTTHLQVIIRFKSSRVRVFQVKKIISVIKNLNKNVVLTGDFNSKLDNKEMKLLSKILSRIGGTKPTWTTVPFDYKDWHIKGLKYRLDNIFISEDLKARNFRILRSKISDHLPIMADITL